MRHWEAGRAHARTPLSIAKGPANPYAASERSKNRSHPEEPMTKAFSRRRVIKTAGALGIGIAAPAVLKITSALAAYPDRPVKFIVANTPGGPSDLVGRMITGALQQSTGKSFIIENIGGAGGNIGME